MHSNLPVRIITAVALFLSTVAVANYTAQPTADILAVMKGHQDTIDAVAVSPDGSLIATASFDKTVRLWDAKTGKELRVFSGPQGHTGQVLAVAFTKNGDQIASGGADNTAKVWDLPVSFPNKAFTASGPLNKVAVMADGKTFAAAGGDGVIKVFPLGEEKGALELKGHVGAVIGVAYTANNQFIISAGADKTVRFWNAADGKPVAVYSTSTADITGFAIAPNGTAAFTTSADNVLRFWQVPPPAAKAPTPPSKEAITSLFTSADGNTALYASADKTATLVSVADGKAAGTFAGAKSDIAAVTLSPDTQTVAAACADGNVVQWDRQGKVKGETMTHAGGATSVAFHPSQPILLTAGADGKMTGWALPIDPKQPKDKATKYDIAAHTGKVNAAAYNPANGQIVSAGADKLIRVWDPAMPMKAVKEIGPLAAPATAIAISRDGLLVAAVVGKDVMLWTIADGKEVGKLTQPADVLSISLSADKSRVLIGRADNVAALVDIPTGQVVQSFTHTSAVRGVSVHPTTPQVITASADKSILITPITATRIIPLGMGKTAGVTASPGSDRVLTPFGKEVISWNSGNGVKEKAFEAGGEATASAFTKDGARVAVGGSDGSVKLYTFADGKMAGSIAAGASVVDLAFHPTLPMLVGVLGNKTVSVWNVNFIAGMPLPPEFGKPVQTFPHAENVTAAAFLADGQFLTTAADKQARRFRIAAADPVKNLPHPNLVDAVAFDDTGTLLATGCHDGNLRVWDVQKAAAVKTIPAHVQTTPTAAQHPIYAVVFTPDSKQVLTASYDKSMKLYDVASGNLVKEFKAAPDPKPGEKVEPPKGPVGHRDQVFTAAFTKDGKLLATGSSDRCVKLWDVTTGNVIRDFPNPDFMPGLPGEPAPSHPGWVMGVRFTPDEKFLVTAGPAPRYRGYLAVWSVGDGKRVFGAERDSGPIQGLAVLPDGVRLVLGCGPKTRVDTDADALIIKMPGK